jgi:putative zinc finger/helix-turn-helix YgiT family protein
MSNESKCFECNNGTLSTKRVELTGSRNGEEFTVSVMGLECSACGFRTIGNEQSGEFTKALSDAYREKHGLLTSQQIRDARRKMGNLSQIEFAKYLTVSPASVKRWEAGLIQDEAMNELIVLKTSLTAALQNCESIAARQSQEACPAFKGGNCVQFDVPVETWQYRLTNNPFTFKDLTGNEVYAPTC